MFPGAMLKRRSYRDGSINCPADCTIREFWMPVHISDRYVPSQKIRLVHYGEVKRNCRSDTVNGQFAKSPPHSSNRVRSRHTMNDELPEERIIMEADLGTRFNTPVPPHAGSARKVDPSYASRGWKKTGIRILSTYPALNGMTVRRSG